MVVFDIPVRALYTDPDPTTGALTEALWSCAAAHHNRPFVAAYDFFSIENRRYERDSRENGCKQIYVWSKKSEDMNMILIRISVHICVKICIFDTKSEHMNMILIQIAVEIVVKMCILRG